MVENAALKLPSAADLGAASADFLFNSLVVDDVGVNLNANRNDDARGSCRVSAGP